MPTSSMYYIKPIGEACWIPEDPLGHFWKASQITVCQVSATIDSCPLFKVKNQKSKIKNKKIKDKDIRYLSLFSISLVLASTVGMCLNTMPSMAFYNEKNEPVCVVDLTQNPKQDKICEGGQPPPWSHRGCLHCLVHPRISPEVKPPSKAVYLYIFLKMLKWYLRKGVRIVPSPFVLKLDRHLTEIHIWRFLIPILSGWLGPLTRRHSSRRQWTCWVQESWQIN